MSESDLDLARAAFRLGAVAACTKIIEEHIDIIRLYALGEPEGFLVELVKQYEPYLGAPTDTESQGTFDA